jgi:diacylglycerol kinase family enzyme
MVNPYICQKKKKKCLHILNSDWKQATNKLTLGVIPAGTGNGLAFSLQVNHFGAARNIIKGYNRPMDLNRVKQDNLDLWSFLSVQWALVR